MLNQFLSSANWLAIIVAAIAYYALGALWFSVLFGKQWMALNGIPEPTPEKKEEMKKLMMPMLLKSLVMSLVLAFAIGLISMTIGVHRPITGVKLGLALSTIGIIPLIMADMYLMKPTKLWFIDAGYHVVGIVLMSGILAAWH
jgi:putative Mn2+ efflux pump MntP